VVLFVLFLQIVCKNAILKVVRFFGRGLRHNRESKVEVPGTTVNWECAVDMFVGYCVERFCSSWNRNVFLAKIQKRFSNLFSLASTVKQKK
jgi:hypothetical protein